MHFYWFVLSLGSQVGYTYRFTRTHLCAYAMSWVRAYVFLLLLCVCVCVRACMYVCVRACARACVRVCLCVRARVLAYTA